VISAVDLVRVLRYDRVTGKFFWRVRRGARGPVGGEAGCIGQKGYVLIRLFRRTYRAHRLAWLYCHGYLPDDLEVDHMNGRPADNRLSNLRVTTHAGNMENQRRARTDNRSGVLGVRVETRNPGRPFVARIVVAGEKLRLGSFATPGEAHSAYVQKKRQVHVHCTI
jgi:hypothetical protein